VASRAEAPAHGGAGPAVAPGRAALPPAPSIGGAVRAAGRNAYYHSWRLLPANVIWVTTAIVLATAALVVPVALLLLPLLALPTAGIFRVTTRIARGQAVSFWDAMDAWRIDVGRTLAIGTVVTVTTLVLGFNLISGLSSESALGWALATLAAWGIVATWLLAWIGWPLIADPDRAHLRFGDRLRLAALLLLAHPVRIGALGIVLAIFLALSAVAIVALLTISVSFAALVASQYALPGADRLEGQLGRSAGSLLADAPAERGDPPSEASADS
jgi:uncharacterized membrane protein YesL